MAIFRPDCIFSQTTKITPQFLKEQGIEAYLPDTVVATNFKHATEEELFKIADVIITIGGDGTIMRYSKIAATYHKPVVGINAGRMGYLANLEQNELGLISKLKTKEYFTERRMMLSVQVVENGETVGEYTALNDAVTHLIKMLPEIKTFH